VTSTYRERAKKRIEAEVRRWNAEEPLFPERFPEPKAQKQDRETGFDYAAVSASVDGKPAEDPSPTNNKEVLRMALEFIIDVLRRSRTRQAALVRLDCARYLVTGYPLPWQIQDKYGVGARRVRQVVREMKSRAGWDKW
jgi:hypothetical protein